MRTVIVGAGNLLLGDEGVGVHAVRELMQEQHPAEVELVDAGTVGVEILHYLQGAGRVVVVDAVNLSMQPGTVVRIRGVDLRAGNSRARSAHDSDILSLLGESPPLVDPQRVVVLGVVPGEVSMPTLELSPAVQRALPLLLEEIRKEMRDPAAQP